MINLKDHDFDGFGAALAPTSLNRTEHLKVFAAVFSHGAQQLGDLKKTDKPTADSRREFPAGPGCPGPERLRRG